jgi:hypothetical protein
VGRCGSAGDPSVANRFVRSIAGDTAGSPKGILASPSRAAAVHIGDTPSTPACPYSCLVRRFAAYHAHLAFFVNEISADKLNNSTRILCSRHHLDFAVNAVDTASEAAAPLASAEAPAPPAAPAGMRHGLVLGTTHDGVDAYNCNYVMNAEEEDPAYDRLSYVVDRRGRTRHAGSKWQVQSGTKRRPSTQH